MTMTTSKTSGFTRTVLTAGLIAVLTTGLAACGEKPAETAPVTAPSGERFTVSLQTVAEMKPVAGEITTRDTAEARARIGGR